MRHTLIIVILSVIATAVYSAPSVVPFRGTLKDVTQESETSTTTVATTVTTKATPAVVTSTTTATLVPRVFAKVADGDQNSNNGSVKHSISGSAPSRSVVDAASKAACADSFTVWLDDKKEFPVTTLRCSTYTVVYIPSSDGVSPKYFKDEITSIAITGGSTEDLSKAEIKINGDKTKNDLKDSPDNLDAAGVEAGKQGAGRLLADEGVTALYSFVLKDGEKFDVIVPKADANTGYTLSMNGKQVYSGVNSGMNGANSGVFTFEDGKLLNNGKDILSSASGLNFVLPSLLVILAAFFVL